MEMQHHPDIEACSTWLEIDLGAIKNNIDHLERLSGCPVMPIVKANAYGHGLVEVSGAAQEAGVKWLGVARIEEALTLRKAGISTKILVLGYTPPKRIPEAIQEDISITVYDRTVALAYSKEARSSNSTLKIHVKVDTGMGRLGIFPKDAVEFMEFVIKAPGLSLEGVFTHFARADEPALPTTEEQIARFNDVLKNLEKTGIHPEIVHAANSAGDINFPPGRYDIARCGIAVYGLNPSSETKLPRGFKPSLSWKTHLTAVKILPPNHGVSYNFHYFTKKTERIGVIAIGYADGFRRVKGNVVLIHGKRVPVVGAVCMDQCMVQLDEVPDAKIGDEVVLIGRQGEEEISADEIATTWGTINYEVICGLADRVPRFHFEQNPA